MDISKLVKSQSVLTTQQIVPTSVRCPKGTVMVRRVQKEEISKVNFGKFWVSPGISSSRKIVIGYDIAQGHQVSVLTNLARRMIVLVF